MAGEAAVAPSSLMAGEIAEQPSAVERTLVAMASYRQEVSRLLRRARFVVFLAHGTSAHAALYGQYVLATYAGIPSFAMPVSIATDYAAEIDLQGAVAIGISQSGATEDVVDALMWARSRGAGTLAITNEAMSALAGLADVALVTMAGPEQAIPATKTFLSQLAALATVGLAALGEHRELEDGLSRLPDELARVLGSVFDLDAYSAAVAAASQVAVVGAGCAHPVALEIALKFRETAYLAVSGFAAREFVHGPTAVLGEDAALVLVGLSRGTTLLQCRALADLARSRNTPLVVIGGDGRSGGDSGEWVPAPELPEVLQPLGLVLPGQVLAERIAKNLGYDPDRPRGLVKVTDPPTVLRDVVTPD